MHHNPSSEQHRGHRAVAPDSSAGSDAETASSGGHIDARKVDFERVDLPRRAELCADLDFTLTAQISNNTPQLDSIFSDFEPKSKMYIDKIKMYIPRARVHSRRHDV